MVKQSFSRGPSRANFLSISDCVPHAGPIQGSLQEQADFPIANQEPSGAKQREMSMCSVCTIPTTGVQGLCTGKEKTTSLSHSKLGATRWEGKIDKWGGGEERWLQKEQDNMLNSGMI